MTVDTVTLGKLQAACVSKIIIEIATLLWNITENVSVVLRLATLNTAALLGQGGDTPIDTVVTAATGVKKS